MSLIMRDSLNFFLIQAAYYNVYTINKHGRFTHAVYV